MSASPAFAHLVEENEASDYVEAFGLLTRLETLVQHGLASDPELVAKRAYLQAASGDALGAHTSCTKALEARWEPDILCLRARCAVNAALCLSGILAFPRDHACAAGLSIREFLESAVRDCAAARVLHELDDEMLALVDAVGGLLREATSDRALRQGLRASCLNPTA